MRASGDQRPPAWRQLTTPVAFREEADRAAADVRARDQAWFDALVDALEGEDDSERFVVRTRTRTPDMNETWAERQRRVAIYEKRVRTRGAIWEDVRGR